MKEPLLELLDELGDIFNTTLYPDTVGSCHILVNKKIPIQIKIDNSGEKLLIGSFLVVLPPGKFKENILFEALRFNYFPIRVATFGYSTKKNSLTLFHYLPLENINGTKVATYLHVFTDLAFAWKEAIESGKSAPLDFKRQIENFHVSK